MMSRPRYYYFRFRFVENIAYVYTSQYFQMLISQSVSQSSRKNVFSRILFKTTKYIFLGDSDETRLDSSKLATATAEAAATAQL